MKEKAIDNLADIVKQNLDMNFYKQDHRAMTDFFQYLRFGIQDSAFSLLPVLLMLAFLLDLAIGDPRWLPHPVRIMGSAISRTEIYLRKIKSGK